MNNFYPSLRKLCLVVVWLSLVYAASAQSINNYVFSTNTSSSLNRTFGSLVDDVDMSSGTTVLVGGSQTAGNSVLTPIGFDFYVNGTRQTQFNATSNGWVGIGTAANTAFGFLSATGIRVAPMLGSTSSIATSSIGRVHSKLIGSQPNRVLVVEFLRMAINSSVVNDTNTFQVRLYESNGAIEIVYGRMYATVGSALSFNIGFQLSNTIYQHVNTTTNTASTSVNTPNTIASTGYINNLNGSTPGNQRAYMWVPNPPDDPGVVNVSNITTTSMQVSWNDASNEIAYALYRSTDGGVTYTFVGQAAANTTAVNITGLIANTTYNWRVYSIRESVSAPADGSGTTLPASKFFTTASGNWSDPSIWNTLAVPSAQDSAEISVGHGVVLDLASQASGTLIVKGTLSYWASTAAQTMTVNGDVIVESTGNFNAGTGTGSAGLTPFVLNIGGNTATANVPGSLVVNGTFDMQTTAAVQTVFFGAQNATLTGSGSTCDMPFILVNKGTSVDATFEILRVYTQPSATSTYFNTQRISATSGTLKISAPVVTSSIFTTTAQLVSTVNGRVWLNNSGISIGMAPAVINAGTLSLSGELRIDAGSLSLGTGSQNHFVTTNGVLRINGGSLTLSGGFQVVNIATAQLIITGGRLIIDPQSTQNLSNFTSAFTINGLSVFTMTGGTVEIVDPHSVAGGTSINIASGGSKSITGGSFIIGNDQSNPSGGTFATNSGFAINSAIPFYKLIIKNNISTFTSRFCRLLANTTVNDSLVIESNGYLQTGSVATGFTLSALGHVRNEGTLSGVAPGSSGSGIGSVSLEGTSAQIVGGAGTTSSLTLRIANANGINFNNTGTWTLERINMETGNVTNISGAIALGAASYRGTIAIGGLNETTTAGSFSTIPAINNSFGNPNYIYGPAANTLQTGSFNEMAAGAVTMNNLTVNDAQGITANRNVSVTGTLTLTAGNLNIGNNNLTLGVSAVSTGTLARTNGFVQLGTSGTFTRWYSTANSPAFDYASGFPLSTGTRNRSILLSLGGSFPSAGGSLTVRHGNITGFTDVTPSFVDGTTTINRRSNSYWLISSTSTPNIGAGTLSVRVIGEGIGAISNVAELRLVKSTTNAGGTSQVGSGTTSTPEINRDFTQANLLGGALFDTLFVGTNSGINPLSPTIIAINTGSWNDANTWEGGVIPTISNSATIASGVNVTIPSSYTASCNGLSIQAGGTLTASAGTLNSSESVLIDGTLLASGSLINVVSTAGNGITVNSGGTLTVSAGIITVGPSGGGNRTLTDNGTFNITGGTINLNGNFIVGSAGAFNQSGGDLNIDPNSGTAGTSTTAGTHIVAINSSNLNCSAGNITVVDPPHNSIGTGTTMSLRITATSSISAFTGSHTFRFGNGSSTETGNANGFVIDVRRSGLVPIQNVVVNGGNATGRWLSTSYNTGTFGTYIKGSLTINTGSEFRHTTASTLAVGGDITNNGTMTTANTITLGGVGYVINNAQSISGTGTFRNSATSSTASFGSMTIDNGNGLTLSTSNTNISYSGTLNIGALKITTGATNSVVITSTGTLTRTTGYIVGNLGRNVAVGSNVARTFEIGSTTDYLPVTVTYPSVTTAGIITLGINAGDHPQIATSCINSNKSINRYWRLANSGAVTTGGNYTFNFLIGDADGGANLAAAKLFVYDGSNWQSGITGTASTTTFAVTGLNDYGDVAIGEITPVPTSVSISASSSTICTGTNVTFTATITNGGSAPTYQWKVNGSNVATTSTYSSSTLNNGDLVTCSIVSNSPCVVAPNATSNTITMTVSPLTVAGGVTGGSTICSGSNSGILTLSGQTGSVVRWESASDAAFTTPTNLGNAGSSTFTSGALTASTYFRAVVQSGACAAANSSSTQVVVDQPSVAGTISGNNSVCSGSSAGNLTLSGFTGSIVRWESAVAPFSTFTPIANTTSTQSAGSPTQTIHYRAVVKNGTCADATTTAFVITVIPSSVGGTVSSNQTICSGGAVSALTLSGQTGTVTKWQSANNASFTGATDISGTAGLTSYTPTGVTSNTYYRAVVQSGGCTPANSASVLITVNPAPVGGNITGTNSICSGSSPGTLTLTGATGSVSMWQSNNGGGWVPISNTTSSYNPGTLTTTTSFRAVLTSGICTPDTSAAFTVTVSPATVGGTVSSSQTICSGGSVTALTLSGQTGTVTKWQSANNVSFTGATDISGTAGLTSYTPTGVTSTTYYRAVVQSGVCATANSASALITVTPGSVGGTVSSDQTICSGGSVSALTLSGQTGTVTKWQSANNASFTGATDISGTAGLTSYTPTGVTSTTYYRAVVQSGSCTAANATAALITVTPASVGGTVSSDQTICSGGSVTALTLSGQTGTVTKWQSANNASFTGATDISGTAGLTSYTPTGVTSTTYYRAVVQSGSCTAANAAAALITVTPGSVGGTVSSDQTICSGSSVSALTLSGQTGTVTKWQSANNASFTGATDISGTSGLTSYTPTGVTSTTYYRAVVQSGLCTAANSASALITVNPTSVGGTVSSDQTICSGGSVTALTLSGQTGTVTKWQSANNASFTGATDISGTAGLTSYTPTGVTSTTYYRAVVQSGVCVAANSASALITVTPGSVGGTVSSDQTICSGGSVTALTLSGQTGTVTKWQSANNASFTGATDISGTSGLTSYTPTGVTSTTYYRAVVQSGLCTAANSVSALITVNPTSVGGTVSSDQTICSGGSVTALTLSGQTGTVTKWQSANNASFTGATDISGTAGLTSYTPTAVTSTTYYRAVVQSGSCTAANAAAALITVTPASVGGTVSSDQTICSGSSVTALTLSGQTGTVTKWQSANNASFTGATDISGTAGLTSYTPTGVTSTTYYRAVVSSSGCTPANSVAALITVNPAPVGGLVSGSTPICSGSSTNLFLAGQTGTITKWQSANNAPLFDNWSDIANTTTTLTTSALTQTTRFRAVVSSGSCTPANSNDFEVSVTASGIWVGAINGNWNNAGNWCGGVPTAATNVVIPAGTLNAPVINVTTATANNVTIDAGATLAFTGTTNVLDVKGSLTVNGTFTTTNGTVTYSGSAAQTVAGITYHNLRMNGSGVKSLGGNATVNNTLTLTSGNLQLGAFGLTLGNSATVTGASASSYVVTDGSGAYTISNVGAVARTFDVGSTVSYTPVTVTNAGIADNISVKVLQGAYNTYLGETGSGAPIAANVVNKTFIVNEAVPGGSLASITFQWNAGDESGMNRSQTIVGRYNGSVWSNISGTPSASSGSGPYTYGITGVTSLGIFGVGDANSPLPVKLVAFNASLRKGIAVLDWTTASEINASHFEVERSVDGYNFSKVGTVKARGNSSTRVDYSFGDKESASLLETNNVLYYRLKQVDLNGEFEYSRTASVSQFDNAVFEVTSTVPNPMKSQTVITYKTSSNTVVDLQLNDAFGKVVSTNKYTPVIGSNTLTLNIDEQFEAGVYFARITQDGHVKVVKIIKQ